MNVLTTLLIGLIFVLNLVFAPASFAEPETPSYAKNPDYIQITQSLNTLKAAQTNQTLAQTATPEQIQKQIADLEFQKYTLETGPRWGQCQNQTGKTIAVYGPKRKKSPSSYENALYFLENGQTTAYEWDCDGIYLPAGIKVSSLDQTKTAQEIGTPLALKIVDGTQLTIKNNPETSALEFTAPFAQIFTAGEVNWFIPDVAQAAIESRVANAPTLESEED
ncbi:hypothetical protein NG798_14805 [Ancylothrix sp. C2]|uniref:hypothetical protein n=1 Tax=Ancylothrix sp. D3o TaxID=2953691 RepID=UPI0021BB32D8|nr:hypothetical protein [Ancylothrix sp. D3o]MCT7951066.1 hypothetical protein [Ancylothrix sp. D3o]